jgi:hypothetical protein
MGLRGVSHLLLSETIHSRYTQIMWPCVPLKRYLHTSELLPSDTAMFKGLFPVGLSTRETSRSKVLNEEAATRVKHILVQLTSI